MGKWEEQVRLAYDKMATKYSSKRQRGIFYNELLEMPNTLSMMRKIRSKKVLDLGCGSGIYSEILKSRGAIVSGIDISKKMIDIAKSQVDGIDFKVGSVYKLPYRSNYFDIVLAALVIHYFDDLEAAFREIRRVLKKGGYFVFSTDNPVVLATRRVKGKPREYRVFNNYFKEGKIYKYWSTFRTNMPYRHMTYQTLIKTIIKTGFVIEDYLDTKPIKNSKNVYKSEYKVSINIPWFCAFKAITDNKKSDRTSIQ